MIGNPENKKEIEFEELIKNIQSDKRHWGRISMY